MITRRFIEKIREYFNELGINAKKHFNDAKLATMASINATLTCNLRR